MNGNRRDPGDPHADVERAMVTVRRSMRRRSLARLGAGGEWPAPGGPARPAAIVSDAEFEVLDAVEDCELAGRPATVTSVAVALGLDQPRASKLVAGLVSAGLVRRRADPDDGRRALLVRTRAGRALTAKVHVFRQSVFAQAMADWSDAERSAFAGLLTRFVAGLPAAGSAPD